MTRRSGPARRAGRHQVADPRGERVGVLLALRGHVQVGDQAAVRGLRGQPGRPGQAGDHVRQPGQAGGRGGDQRHAAAGAVAAVAAVLGGDEPAARHLPRPDPGQAAVAVVAPGQHLDQRRVVGGAPVDPLAEQPDQRLRGGHHGLDPVRAVRGVREQVQVAQVAADRGVHPGPVAAQQRLGEPAEHHAPGQVGHRREAHLGGLDEVLERQAGPLAQRLGRRRLGQPLPQQPGHDSLAARHLLLGQEDPEHRRLELRRAVQAGDAVVAEHPGQPRAEALRDAGPLDVQALQVAVEVLARAVHRVAGLGLQAVARLVAAQLGQVGEHREQVQLTGDRLPAGLGAGGQEPGQQPAALGGAAVEAEQQAAQVGQAPPGPLTRGQVRRGSRQAGFRGHRGGRRAAARRRSPARGVLGGDRLQPQQRRARLDLAAHGDQALPDQGAERRPQHGLHLHAFQHDDRRVRVDLVPGRQRGGDHQGRRGGADYPALVQADPVRDPVDLDQVNGPVRGRRQPEPHAVDHDPAAVLVEPLDHDVGLLRSRTGRPPAPAPGTAVGTAAGATSGGNTHPEPLRAQPRDPHPVAGAAELQVQPAAGIVLGLGPAAVRRGQQALPADLLLVLVRLDRRRRQRDPGVLVRRQAALAPRPVDPPGVRAAAHHVRLVEQPQQEALVRGAALDDHAGLGQRPAQPPQRGLPVAAVGDDLGDHRVEVGRDRVAFADPGVDPDAGARGQHQPGDPAGRRGEVAVRVLGVEPRLDRVPGLARPGPLQAAARRHVQLQPDQVRPGGQLGDRVLDLEPRVDLQEGKPLLARVIEELDGRRAPVADGQRQPLRRRLQLRGLLRGQHRRSRLLDDLLVAPLDRAVPHPQRPRRALPVRDQLHLDVARPGDQPLQEQSAAAERPQRLGGSALERIAEILRRGDDPDAAPAAARGGLEHQRVADLLRRGQRALQGRDLAAAPRRDRDADLLGDQLGADLVAQLAHRLGVRPDERDADLLAQFGERRVLGHEAPADPGRVGPALHEGPLQHRMVQVGAGRGGPERVGQVGLPDERCRGVGVGEQSDGLDPVAGFRGQIPGGVDQPHCGFPAVNDRHTTEHRLSLPGTDRQKAMLATQPRLTRVPILPVTCWRTNAGQDAFSPRPL